MSLNEPTTGAMDAMSLGTRHQSLAEQIAAELSARIYSREIEPGTTLSEAGIARQLGVSRSPVREAITLLTADGLVQRPPRRQAFVTRFTEEDCASLYDTRALVDGHLAELAARNPSDEDIERLLKLLDEALAGMKRGAREYRTALEPLTMQVYLMSHNPIAAEIARTLWNRSLPYRALIPLEQRLEKSVSLHQDVVTAICRREPEVAKSRIRAGLLDYKKAILARLTPS